LHIISIAQGQEKKEKLRKQQKTPHINYHLEKKTFTRKEESSQ